MSPSARCRLLRPGGLGAVPPPWLLPAGAGGGDSSRSVRLRRCRGLCFGAWRRDTAGRKGGGRRARARWPARARGKGSVGAAPWRERASDAATRGPSAAASAPADPGTGGPAGGE